MGFNFKQIAIIYLLFTGYVSSLSGQSPLWGLTSQGGQGVGSIIRLNEDGTNFSSVSFPVLVGESPSGDLLKANNGKFYGMTAGGGSNNGGVLFEYDITTGEYGVLHHFAALSIPKGSLIEESGKFYGMTYGGGTFGSGVIFEFNLATSVYTVLYNFGTSVGDGKYPEGSLVVAGGNFYGMTSYGGINDYGSIFEYDPITDMHTVIHSFNDTDGSAPRGSLIVSGVTFYGLTSSGGTSSSGVLFDYNLSAGSINVLHHFPVSSSPKGSLLSYNGSFYGLTSSGGTSSEGSIFKFDPLTNLYNEFFSFDNDTYGSYPFGSLVEAGGKLYGMTNGGGDNFAGVLFEYVLSTSTYNMLHHFNPDVTGGGTFPFGSCIISDGKLYGLTSSGGTAGFGTMFEYEVASGPFNVKVIFENASKGSFPQGELIRSGMNWFGMTMNGGNSNNGTLFKYDPAGSGTLIALHHFSGTDGAVPSGSLISSGGKLYGLTSEGGNNNGGVLFEYNLTTSIYSIKHHFASGSAPKGSLTEWDGMFYGTTSNGGIGSGEIFRFNPITNSYNSLHSFDGAEGAFPTENLVHLSGKLYGMTTTANTHPGVLFQYNLGAMDFEVLHYFAGGVNDGAAPYGSLVTFDGHLYGMTRNGGDLNLGTIFKYDPTGVGNYSILLELDNTTGGNPEGSLTVLGSTLYGMTKIGGSLGGGVVFKCDIDGTNFVVLKNLDETSGQAPFGSLTPTGCINSIVTAINADINPLTCNGNSSNLTVTGLLNNALDWKWYTANCGGTLVGTGTSISVVPQAATTYFVRGEGGCVTETICSTITINFATPTVMNTNDSGAGSLRAALTCALEGSTIIFDPAVLGINDTILISSAALNVNKNIIINQTLPTIVKIKTIGQHPVFNINMGKSLSLNYVNLFMNPNSPSTPGRAIFNNGSLLISNINIRERSQNLSGNGSTIQNVSGSSVNISLSNQIIIQN
ncbi:MAG: hypothetical protein IPO92_03240 [Saprospiraceae bacterium]|nr:hypothetical protein [Saprospiraceae bacterium]